MIQTIESLIFDRLDDLESVVGQWSLRKLTPAAF
jgi:hypothetical protein